ncbi:MAG: hypothetical protein IAE91_11700 [Ignavibacteriaceae bacterium]|nr:hypothetical protein [Ignavibacteriaceae bacterium]
MRKDKIFHVISNTHWDREWRFPFQRNRQMLVDMIDRVLEILEQYPKYRAFHLDSQSIVVKDYLEIKPHKKDLFTRLVKENRLLIGPWYILPEQFQVGGENLVRNLLMGHKISKAHGGVSKMGYSPFSWGQISQLPQIYKNFGIELIMFYRGVNSLDSHNAEFLWEGADGTVALSSRFSTMPRYNFYFYIYRPVVHNETPYDVEHDWKKGGIPFHFADDLMKNEDYYMLKYPDQYFKENIKPSVEHIIDLQAGDFTTPHVVWMEGHDSSGPNEKTVKIIEDIKKEFKGIDVRHSTLEDYAQALRESITPENLPLVKGERRSAQFDKRSGNLYGYTTSARMYLKQTNFFAENLIQFYSEPFYNFAGILGYDNNSQYLNIGWDYLVQNSAHDSIGGCSLDEIHEDMMWRYKQAIEIAKGVKERAFKYLLSRIDMKTSFDASSGDALVFITLFNPLSFSASGVFEVNLDIPQNYDKGFLKILDSSGKSLTFKIIDSYKHEPVLEQMINRPMFFKMVRYKILLEVDEIPEFGYKTLCVNPLYKEDYSNDIDLQPGLVSKKDGNITLENNFIRVRVRENGTLSIKNKISGKVYKDSAYFYDEGESGHAWVNKPTAPILTTLKSNAKIKIIEDNPLRSTVRIKHKLLLPENLKERKSNKPVYALVNISLFVTLEKDSKFIKLTVKLNNTAESHRLRIMFPTGLDVNSHFGEGQFDIVERSAERPDTSEWIEQPMYDFPMHHFAAVTDGKNGVAILVNGLKEYELLNDDRKTLAVTLLRSFEYIIQPSSVEDYSFQKGAQCLGENYFEMAFYPFEGSISEGEVLQNALKYNLEPSIIQTGQCEGNLPPAGSFMQFSDNRLIFSTFKKTEDDIQNSYALRVYNPFSESIQSSVSFIKNPLEVIVSDLEEKEIERVDLISNNKLKLDLKPKEIVTLLVKF